MSEDQESKGKPPPTWVFLPAWMWLAAPLAAVTWVSWQFLSTNDCLAKVGSNGAVLSDPKEAIWYIYLAVSLALSIWYSRLYKQYAISKATLRTGLLAALLVVVAGSWGLLSSCTCHWPQKPWFEGTLRAIGSSPSALGFLCIDAP